MSAVEANHVHKSKDVRPAEAIAAQRSILKMYVAASPDEPVPDSLVESARKFIAAEIARGDLGLDDDLGFAILHRCGRDFHFLLVCVWRSSNELWEAVYYRDSDMIEFAPFGPANPGPPSPLRPTFCVWELGIVRFEAECWTEYLLSPRDDEALQRWHARHFAGSV